LQGVLLFDEDDEEYYEDEDEVEDGFLDDEDEEGEPARFLSLHVVQSPLQI
jgi:hypothetical protein